jgi:hypothetical protein
MRIQKRTNDPTEKAKVDTKKAMTDMGDKMVYAKTDVNADVEKIKTDMEKIKADFEHHGAKKTGAYAKADIKADVERAKADIGKKMADTPK